MDLENFTITCNNCESSDTTLTTEKHELIINCNHCFNKEHVFIAPDDDSDEF